MKAILCEAYGEPARLELKDVDKPVPEAGRVLVRVRASSVNPADYHPTRGGIFRLFAGLLRPKDPRTGTDVAGIVEAVGPGVTRFKPGDEVFGGAPGAMAEYAVAKEDRLALKPANISFAQAGGVAIAATTALQGLRDKGHLQAGMRVLVNGASGGVGTFAVQIAKALGAEVTAVCSPRNLEQARSLGADHVIDYTKEDFTKNGQRYDLVLDIVAKRPRGAYEGSLTPEGQCIVVGFGFPDIPVSKIFGVFLLEPLRSRIRDSKVKFMGMARIDAQDLGILGEFMGSGKVVPVIDRTFPLRETAAAFAYMGEGHARGKVVVTVGPEDAAPPGVRGGSP